MNRRMLELQEIEAERKRQAQRAERRLQDIIDKTEYLAEELKNGEWDERERQRIASNVVAQAKGEGDERFRLVDEIEVVRRQRWVEAGNRVLHAQWLESCRLQVLAPLPAPASCRYSRVNPHNTQRPALRVQAAQATGGGG